MVDAHCAHVTAKIQREELREKSVEEERMSVEEIQRREGGCGPGSGVVHYQDVLGNLSSASDQCAPCDDEEMVDAERDLAEDAQWKKIQQNTFTRWANEHLKTVQKNVGNLETDLSDGLRLISLIEVLSGKRLPKHNKRPNFRSQKLENVSVALRFLEKDEGIRIVNIGKWRKHFFLHILFHLLSISSLMYPPTHFFLLDTWSIRSILFVMLCFVQKYACFSEVMKSVMHLIPLVK